MPNKYKLYKRNKKNNTQHGGGITTFLKKFSCKSDSSCDVLAPFERKNIDNSKGELISKNEMRYLSYYMDYMSFRYNLDMDIKNIQTYRLAKVASKTPFVYDSEWLTEMDTYIGDLSKEDFFTAHSYTFRGDRLVNHFLRGGGKDAFFKNLDDRLNFKFDYFPLFMQTLPELEKIVASGMDYREIIRDQYPNKQFIERDRKIEKLFEVVRLHRSFKEVTGKAPESWYLTKMNTFLKMIQGPVANKEVLSPENTVKAGDIVMDIEIRQYDPFEETPYKVVNHFFERFTTKSLDNTYINDIHVLERLYEYFFNFEEEKSTQLIEDNHNTVREMKEKMKTISEESLLSTLRSDTTLSPTVQTEMIKRIYGSNVRNGNTNADTFKFQDLTLGKLHGYLTDCIQAFDYDKFWIKILPRYRDDLQRIIESAPATKKDTTIYRGVSSDEYFKTNKIHVPNSFVSTSMSIDYVNNFVDFEKGCCLQCINVPKGTRCLFITGISHFENELEILLGYKSQFYVDAEHIIKDSANVRNYNILLLK